MSEMNQKYILNLLSENISNEFEEIIISLNLSIDSSAVEGRDYICTLVDNDYSHEEDCKRIILVGSTDNRKEFFERGGIGIIPSLDNLTITDRVFIKRLLGDNSSLNSEVSMGEDLRSLGTFKVTDHLNSGFYCDNISTKAAKNGFDFFKVKSAVFNLFQFISEIIIEDKGSFPVDVDFGVCGEELFFQSHFPVENLYSDLLFNALSDNLGLLGQVVKDVKAIDIYQLKSSEKLVITTTWDKSSCENKVIFIHGIESFSFNSSIESNGDVKELASSQSEIVTIEKNKKLSLSSVSRIVDYLKHSKVDVDSITISNITDYLDGYPNKSILSQLGSSSKEEILKVLKDSSKYNDIDIAIAQKRSNIDTKDLLNQFLNKIENLEAEEANEIVSIGTQDYTEAAQRVSGWIEQEDNSSITISGSTEDIGEESQLVKGSKEDLTESITTIKGEREDIGTNHEKMTVKSLGSSQKERGHSKERAQEIAIPQWRSAKDNVINSIRERIDSNNITDDKVLKEELAQLLQKNMNIDATDSNALVEGIIKESIIDSIELEPSKEVESLELEELKSASAKKDIQLSRMMKLIDAMKKELLVKSSGVSDGKDADSTIENENKKLRQEIEMRDKQIDILKSNNERISSNYDQEKAKLSAATENIATSEVSNVEVKSLESKVKSLEAKLNEAKERSEILNNKLEEERSAHLQKLDADTIHFREKMMKSQQLISKSMKENRELANEVERLQNLQSELSQVVPDTSKSDVNMEELNEKEKEVEALSLEIKKSNDQSKAFGLKIKQLEQKNKFLMAQLEEASKQKKGGHGKSSAGSDVKSQHKIKHLEKLNENFKREASNAKNELAEKKKENLKFKQEANALKIKITELERKVAISKKKAA